MSKEFEEKTTKELSNLRAETKELNAKLDKVNERLDNHDKKFDAIDKKFDAIDKRFENVDRQFDAIGAKFDEVDNKLDNITTILESVQRSVVLMEQKLTVDIPALFDGYTAHQEIQERQQGEINSLNKKVDNHDIRISILEQKTI